MLVPVSFLFGGGREGRRNSAKQQFNNKMDGIAVDFVVVVLAVVVDVGVVVVVAVVVNESLLLLLLMLLIN